MTIKEILKDKFLFVLINFVLFLGVSLGLVAINTNGVLIFLLFCIWFAPLVSYIAIESIKLKRYYEETYSVMESLERKYLLPEVVKEANSIEGKILNKIIGIVGRDMHENVNRYKHMQSEYREYIETWVHEIKTPIASAKLIVENNQSPAMERVDAQINRIESYIEQVLYYSRSNDVSEDYIVKGFSLKDSVLNVVKRNSRDFISKKIKLEIGDIEELVYSDPKWVEFILNQIVGNSIKYSRQENAVIKVCSRAEKHSVVLSICDNGIGISEKDIGRVFEKGFTGENGRLFSKATGMGLYLSHKLCRKLGLGIEIESREGSGTKVEIVFPLRILV